MDTSAARERGTMRWAQLVAAAVIAIVLVATTGATRADAGGPKFDVEQTHTAKKGDGASKRGPQVALSPAVQKVHLDLSGVYLDGPLGPIGTIVLPNMNTVLANSGAVPTTEPFTAAGYTRPEFENPGHSVPLVPPAVDWVLIELRDPTDIDVVVAARAAFVTSWGRVITEDNDPLTLQVNAGCYHIAVQHRNHIGFASAAAVDLDSGPLNSYTMGDPSPACSGSTNGIFGSPTAHISHTVGGQTIFVMAAGDVNFDGVINAADRSQAYNDQNLSGYQMSDADLDADVDATDRQITWANRNIVQPFDM